jgi:hypothetical protein
MTTVGSTSDAKRGLQLVQTDYYGLGGDASLIQSVHMQWDSALVCSSITIWACNFPDLGSEPFGVALTDPATGATAGSWIQLNPPTGYTAISPAGAATIGATTPLVIVVPGGTAGGIFVDIGNTGARRLRAVVVCTTQGQLRIRTNGKF